MDALIQEFDEPINLHNLKTSCWMHALQQETNSGKVIHPGWKHVITRCNKTIENNIVILSLLIFSSRKPWEENVEMITSEQPKSIN